MIHSKQILSITNAAVDALSSARDVYNDKRTELRGESLQRTSKEDATSRTRLNPDSPCSTADDRVTENTSGDMKENSSSSLLEMSFNGTQRVKVPSRLLREIKSPLERSSSSSESKEIPGVSNIVDEQTKPTPVKVIRHVNGPSAWISSNADDPPSGMKPVEPVKTLGEPSRDDPTNATTWHRFEERSLAGKQVSEVTVRHIEDKSLGPDTFEPKKNVLVKGLFQGQPKSGVPVFESGKENGGDVKVKRFTLNDKEKALKEQFLKRQDQRKPTKKLVQPTLVSPQTEERKDTQDGLGGDNPVATAAAIAAAAASAATGPFLQLQHSLEAQIAALVSNLQVLQQNHNRQHEQQDKDREKELQQQMEDRLQRLEELQAKMLQAQSLQSAPVSDSSGIQNPSATTHPSNSLNPAVMLPSGHVTAPATYHPGPVVCYQSAPGRAWQDDATQPQYVITGGYQPHPTHESLHDHKALHSYPGSMLAFEKCKLVRNTRTQTSPQESVSSEESPLRTPLPRKRPPIPTSRYNLPRSHANRLHSDVDRGVKRKARVRVEPDVSPTLPSYMNEMTDKGRGLVRELVSQDSAARSYNSRLETHKPPDRSAKKMKQTHTTDTDTHKDKGMGPAKLEPSPKL